MSDPAPALKEMFNEARYREIARVVGSVHPRFDQKRFLDLTLPGLDPLALLQRLRRATEALRATLSDSYLKALAILRKVAPQWGDGFTSLVLPDFVGLYGRDHFDESLDALQYFTRFGSSEFAIREFLRLDFDRTLRTMVKWAADPNEHVRRLASEGSRPRLPWSFKLRELIADPTPTAPILEKLKADPSLYVRKSVANHLNDITKDHPAWVLDRVEGWDLSVTHTAWIAKRALRSLIKAGDRRALAVIGAGTRAEVVVESFRVSPRRIVLGEDIELELKLCSTARKPQRLVIDYAIHYVKKSSVASRKVFKWKEITLGPEEIFTVAKKQTVRDFTTRKHHAGKHLVELMVNGEVLAEGAFELAIPA